MINFNCDKCGKSFALRDELAGRSGTCKACGAALVVPATNAEQSSRIVIKFDNPADASPVATTPAAGASPRKTIPVRTRRLMADADHVHRLFANSPLIHVRKAEGDPPEKYQIEYRVGGLARGPMGIPVPRDTHLIEIQLTREYPRQSPKCRMLTPIFHPNIDPVAICVGDHWTAAEKLADLIVRIGEMISFQAYNIKSPLDGEAAMWADQSSQLLPIDNRPIRPPELN